MDSIPEDNLFSPKPSTSGSKVLAKAPSKQSITKNEIQNRSLGPVPPSPSETPGKEPHKKISKQMKPSVQFTESRRSCRRNRRSSTMATGRPKVGCIDFERLKAEVYRDWVGRRDAMDLGNRKTKPDKSNKNKKTQANEEKEEKEESETLESCQIKGVTRNTKGMVASLGQVEDVQRRAEATTPLVRKNSSNASKPLRTPSNTVLRVGSTAHSDVSSVHEVSIEDAKKLEAVRQKAQQRRASFLPKVRTFQGKDILTREQVRAFKEVFDLFDSNGGGTIDADELDLTLRSVNICLSRDEITEVLSTIDKDGSGEIDFAEFLHLMTSTERFLATLTSGREAPVSDLAGREVLLFEALTEFMKKSAINSMDEIVGYYRTKYKKSKVPHVVNHYAAGARLIGLTEKQLKEHIDSINKAQQESGESCVSPYAQALPIVLSCSDVSKAVKERKKTGKIKLKIRLASITGEVNLDITGGNGKGQLRPSKVGSKNTQTRGRGWLPQRTRHIAVELPEKKLAIFQSFHDFNLEDLPFIRQQVTLAKEMYFFQKHKEHVRESMKHWKSLSAHLISPTVLRHHFRQVFSTYTTIEQRHLPFPRIKSCSPTDVLLG